MCVCVNGRSYEAVVCQYIEFTLMMVKHTDDNMTDDNSATVCVHVVDPERSTELLFHQQGYLDLLHLNPS